MIAYSRVASILWILSINGYEVHRRLLLEPDGKSNLKIEITLEKALYSVVDLTPPNVSSRRFHNAVKSISLRYIYFLVENFYIYLFTLKVLDITA